MPDDIFDHDDGIVDQYANRKDQGEQSHPVQRVPEDIEDRKREGQSDRHSKQNYARLPPAKGKRDQQGDRECRDEQVLKQFVRLVLGSLAVVARNRNIQVRRKHVAAQGVDLL